ncbi:hypothetical protein WN51_07417 [Melipona quadrifasciata]|uniref:Uncharacterized protein n=1 Tax=Melipona quadrifasciata TaxID=166423 RepID=A0A0M8ZPY7_9HYME|nr:hypothetical protein WN51_07417 [Melipona quadrifasciata]
MAAEETVHDGRAATEASQQGRSAGGQGTGPSSDPGCAKVFASPFRSPRPGTSAKPASRPSPTRPAPQSQSLFRSYGSNLPTSLTYINLSTRGSLPWRPAADMGTNRRDTSTWPSPGFSRSEGKIRTPPQLRKPENLDDSDDQLNASSSSPGIDGGSAPPTHELCVTRGLYQSSTFRDDLSVPSISRTYDGHSAAHQSHYRGVADQKRSPKHKSARNRQQAHRDDRCQLNRLRIIGNTGFINAIRSSENIARKEVLHSDNEHHRNRADNIANVPRRHSKIRSVARRNYASTGIQPVAKASVTIGTVPATKFGTVNDRQRNLIADGATRVQRQPRFVRRAAGETVREYQECVLNANLRPAEQHSQSNRQQRVPAAPKPAQTRAVENPAPQSRSVTIQRPFRAKSVDALEKIARDPQIARDSQIARISRLLQLEGAVSERSRADHDARITARPRSPQDLGSWREPEQPLQQLVPQPRPADRVQIQDNLPANTHVVIHGKMNLKREPFLPDIDDAHHANDSNIIKRTMIIPEGRDHNDAGGFLAANYGKQQQQDDCTTSDSETLDSSHSINILQTQYLLKTSLTLSSLLLDGEPRSRNISEQNDSGIHRVTSSENTSPYDESHPQKKGTSATKNQQTRCLDGKEAMENASYSCSNLSSTTSDSPCVCNLTNARTVTSLDHSIRVHDPHAKKYIPRISSNFNGANEEFFGAAHVNGQISV